MLSLSEIDTDVLERDPERYSQSAEVFFLNYLPHSIYNRFSTQKIDFELIRQRLSKYIQKHTYPLWQPVDGVSVYMINNFDSSRLGISDEKILELYENELLSVLSTRVPVSMDKLAFLTNPQISAIAASLPWNGSRYSLGVGNVNTFFTAENDVSGKTSAVLQQFLESNENDLTISISENGLFASRFIAENEFSGRTKDASAFLHPVFTYVSSKDMVFKEFNALLSGNHRESVWEDFFRTNYKTIFGEHYDRISTQLWLEFPQIDIGKKNRRMDIFMRNSVLSDWELFELKRPDVQLTRTKSDVPLFTAAVNEAIAQVKNYKRILQDDAVKRKMEAAGIEYYVPRINLVIGKKPSLPTAQWRQLLADNSGDITITTYDALLLEAKQRHSEISKLLI